MSARLTKYQMKEEDGGVTDEKSESLINKGSDSCKVCGTIIKH